MEDSQAISTCAIGTNEKLEEDDESKDDREPAENTMSLCQKWKDPDLKGKFIYTMFMAAVFVAVGMFIGQHGATFLDIQIITDTDIEAASAFFTAASAGFLTGSAIVGFVYNKMNEALLLFILALCLGITNIFLPYCAQYELMLFVRYISSVCAGGLNTGIHSEHMRLWGSDAKALLQFAHFTFSFGGFISPLIAEPFLAEKRDSNKQNKTTQLAGNVSINSTNHRVQGPNDTRVEYLYLIVGILVIVCSFPFLFVFIRSFGKTKSVHKVEKRQFTRKGVPFPLLAIVLFGMCIFFFVYCGAEDTFLSFLMTFLVKEFDSISKTKGAYITSITWASFAVARFLMIFMNKILSSIQLLFLMTTMMAVGVFCFTICAYFGVVDALVVFSAITAVSFSGVFASGFSWMESEMFQVTGLVSSFIIIAGSLGSIVNPLILGYLMEEVSNIWYCYLLLTESLVLCFLLSVMFLFSRFYVDKKYGTLASSLKTTTRDTPETGGNGIKNRGDNNTDDAEDRFIN